MSILDTWMACLITLDCDQGWVLCQRESLWFAPFVQFLQHLAFALTLQLCPLLDDILNMSSIERGIGTAIRNWEKKTPLHHLCMEGSLFVSAYNTPKETYWAALHQNALWLLQIDAVFTTWNGYQPSTFTSGVCSC